MADSKKIWIQRAPGKEVCTMLPYHADGNTDKYSHWYPDANVQDFEVSADIGAAAIASGYFTERPGSATTLKAASEASK
jgi:hypothetical protein